jgi:drug/metabolite transporter (DMT)-like permease
MGDRTSDTAHTSQAPERSSNVSAVDLRSSTASSAGLRQAVSAFAAGDRKGAERSRYLALIALALLALIGGYNWVVMKEALRYSEPLALAAIRNCISGLLLVAALPVLGRPIKPRALGFTVVVGVLQMSGPQGLATLALWTGGAGKTSVLTYTMPFWLLLMAWVVLGERLKGFQWLALAFMVAGLIAVLSPCSLHGPLSSGLAVAAGVSWAASAVLIKKFRHRYAVDLFALNAWQMLLGSIPLIVAAAFTTDRAPTWSAAFIAALVYVVILGSAVWWFLWLYVLDVLPANVAGMSSLAVPVVGVAAAGIQLKELPTPSEGVGMGLIVFALCILFVNGARRRASRF